MGGAFFVHLALFCPSGLFPFVFVAPFSVANLVAVQKLPFHCFLKNQKAKKEKKKHCSKTNHNHTCNHQSDTAMGNGEGKGRGKGRESGERRGRTHPVSLFPGFLLDLAFLARGPATPLAHLMAFPAISVLAPLSASLH